MIALSTPTVWTPRAGPWWRMPRWADIAQYAKKLQFRDGKLAFKNGKPVITEEGNPCCCGSICPTVIFEDTELLTCSPGPMIISCGPSFNPTTFFGWLTTSGEDYDGTYTMAAPDCNSYVDSTTTTVNYRRTNCSGTIECTSSGIGISLLFSTNGVTATARVRAFHRQETAPACCRVSGEQVHYFDGTDTAPHGDPIAIANALGSSLAWHLGGTAGTATVIY